MANHNDADNGVNGTELNKEGSSPGRCPTVQQCGLGCHQDTASNRIRHKRNKEVNVIIVECYIRSNPVNENGVPIRGYRKECTENGEKGAFLKRRNKGCATRQEQ